MLGSVVRRAIAPVLREAPPACGIVSITRVEVSADASYATVYITALEESEQALRYLERRCRDLQRSLGSLPRRKIPLLRFRIDGSGERGRRIDALLKKLERP